MKMLKKIDDYLKKTVTLMVYDDSRKKIAFVGLNAVLALVSLIMSVVNFFTAEYIFLPTGGNNGQCRFLRIFGI